MNFVDAGVLANKLDEECGIKKLRRHKQPVPRRARELLNFN